MEAGSSNGKFLSYHSNLVVDARYTNQTIRDSDHAFVPVGEGNVVSIEFNLLYRWHATLSAPDTAWTTETFEGIFEGSNPAEVKKLLAL